MLTWTDADRELEFTKGEILKEDRRKWLDAIVDAFLDFIGFRAIKDYLQNQEKTAWDHFVALLIAGAWAEAIYFILKFLYTLLNTKSGWAAIAAIIGEEGLKAFFKNLAKSWLFWLLILDLIWVITKLIRRLISANERLAQQLKVLYLTTEAPHRDEVFETNGVGVPKGD
jgi:hypothetical protein